MNLSDAKSLIADLERHPHRIQLFDSDLEAFILWSMDAVFELAKRGDDDDHKMRLVGLEYRARLLLERWR